MPERIGPKVFFSQTCGYPLETIFSGQAIRLGTPCYAVPGCDGPTHCGLFIVPAGSAARELRDLRGGVFLFNRRSHRLNHDPLFAVAAGAAASGRAVPCGDRAISNL